jgi:hypothetical protein
MEGDIHGLVDWVGALALVPAPAIFGNYRSANPGSTMTAVGQIWAFRAPSPTIRL